MRRHKMMLASAGLWLMLTLSSFTWMSNVGTAEASESGCDYLCHIFKFKHDRNSRTQHLQQELNKCLKKVTVLKRSISRIYDRFAESNQSNDSKLMGIHTEKLNRKAILLHRQWLHCERICQKLVKLNKPGEAHGDCGIHSSPYLATNSSPYLATNSSPYLAPNSSPYLATNSTPYPANRGTPYFANNLLRLIADKHHSWKTTGDHKGGGTGDNKGGGTGDHKGGGTGDH